MRYIPAHGNPNAKLVILGDAPSYDDVKSHEKNWELFKLLESLGFSRSNCWFTTVSKYFVPPNPRGKRIPFVTRAKNNAIDIDKEFRDIHIELAGINPNCILALGGTALWTLTNETSISNYRGSILPYNKYKVVGTYDIRGLSSPSYAEFRGYWNRAVIKHDINRAIRQSAFPEIRRPYRTLSIARSSHQLRDFIERNKHHSNRVAADIEARGSCLPFCIGFAFTRSEGIAIPFWNRGEIESLFRVSDQEMVQMWILINYILNNFGIIGQNFKYDDDKLYRIGFRGNLVSDLLLKSQAINPEFPKSLGFQTSIHTEEPFYKNDGMYEGSVDNLLIGCARDACVTKEIDEVTEEHLDQIKTRDYYENFLVKFHKFYLAIETEGFIVNSETREKLFAKYIEWSENLKYELYQLVGDYINIKSPKQVGILLYEVFKIPQRVGTSEEVLTDILNSTTLKLTDDKRRAIEIILEDRRVEKTISTYLSALPDFDGKMRTSYFPCLETGRSSTGQLEPPIRPAIAITDSAGKKKLKPIGIAFQTMTKHGDIGADVRSQYEPEKGYVLLQADSSQAEARVIWLLADDEEALRLVDEVDYHALTATWFFGINEELHNYNKKKLGYEHPIRFIGKTLRHAGHLGQKAKNAAIEVNTSARKYKIPIKITEAIADRSLKIFHNKQPKIRGVYHEGIIRCLDKDKRYLTAAVPYGINARQGGKRQFFERWADELHRQAFSYIPQRSISDNTKAAGIRLSVREPRLTRIIVESHDSLLFTVPERELDYFAPMVKEEMERPLRFDTCSIPRRDLIIPCEQEIGYNYMELNKYKVA